MNYKSLQEIYDNFSKLGLQILAFPCNQFGGQEPHTAEYVESWAKENYDADFPILEKVDVTGPNAHPLYQWLQSQPGCDQIEWNFDKFLIDADGKVVQQLKSGEDPLELVGAIEDLYYDSLQ